MWENQLKLSAQSRTTPTKKRRAAALDGPPDALQERKKVLFIKKNLTAVLCSLLLFCFTAYILLDTFVITRVYTVVEPNPEDEAESDDGGEQQESGTTEPVVTENTYVDENISIALTVYREYYTDIYVAEVVLSSADLLKTAFADNSYGRNITEKTSAIAESCGAVLAINGDYYGAQTKGYVIRNGVLYRSSAVYGQEDLVIYADGSFEIITEDEVSADSLISDGAQQVLSFGPALVVNGQIAVTEDEEVGKAKASNPRTAIAIIDECHYLFIVSDGRIDESEGLSLYELAQFIRGLGADIAYNLDGGGSSTMYFNGEVINNPTTNGSTIKERSVSDIVYIG